MKNLVIEHKLLCLLMIALLFTGIKGFSQNLYLPQEKGVIIMKDGNTVKNAGLWDINSNILVYEQDGNLHDVIIADIRKIRMPQADYVFNESGTLERECTEIALAADSSQTPTLNQANILVPKTVNSRDHYKQGYNDAEKYYNGTGAAIGGFFSGIVPGLGWFISMPIISATRPVMYNTDNPNLLKLEDKDYRAGYKKKATDKKLANVFGGFGLGLVTVLVMIL